MASPTADRSRRWDPDSLERTGYVRAEPDTTLTYLAPDENVLLSESFLRTHCFSAPGAKDGALAELRFKPVRGRRLPDVEGSVFVDTLSGELRRIDYRYVAPALAGAARGDACRRQCVAAAAPRWALDREPLGDPDAAVRAGATRQRDDPDRLP